MKFSVLLPVALLALSLGACSGLRASHADSVMYQEEPAGPPAAVIHHDHDEDIYHHRESVSRHRGKPSCGGHGTFSEQYGKCIDDEVHDIELTPAQKATFASCDRIETRQIMKGNKLVTQQRGIGCQRPQ